MTIATEMDPATLDALRESVAGVLAEQCDSTALHAFIDGKTVLDRDLWNQAASLGWLGFGIAEQHGGLGLGLHGLAILHTELGRQAAPGPYIATLCAGQAIAACGTDAARKTWLPRIAVGGIRAAIPACLNASLSAGQNAGLTLSSTGVSGTLCCLGCPDAAFVLAPASEAWVIVELAGVDVTAVPMWDRTRETINIRLRD
ncbi:MAG: acyl-CoA dehydrogenase family protein, partial [Gemmatimonadota bacterium]|nr:acyl-CoA dehydrogenase family protein [Gemmatimonadota bacterium]